MQAPTIEELYKVEEYVEAACKTLLTGAGIANVYTQRDKLIVSNPRVDVQLALGSYQHVPIQDFQGYWRDAIWAATLGFRVVTKRSKDNGPAYNSDHANIKAQIRALLSQRNDVGFPVAFTPQVLPYHGITKCVLTNCQLSDERDDDLDVSHIHYDTVVQILDNAWPS